MEFCQETGCGLVVGARCTKCSRMLCRGHVTVAIPDTPTYRNYSWDERIPAPPGAPSEVATLDQRAVFAAWRAVPGMLCVSCRIEAIGYPDDPAFWIDWTWAPSRALSDPFKQYFYLIGAARGTSPSLYAIDDLEARARVQAAHEAAFQDALRELTGPFIQLGVGKFGMRWAAACPTTTTLKAGRFGRNDFFKSVDGEWFVDDGGNWWVADAMSSGGSYKGESWGPSLSRVKRKTPTGSEFTDVVRRLTGSR